MKSLGEIGGGRAPGAPPPGSATDNIGLLCKDGAMGIGCEPAGTSDK